jgi:peroxidase
MYTNRQMTTDDIAGQLKTSQGVNSRSYLPRAVDNACRDTDARVRCFAAGEGRTNENLGLVGLQMLFMREHNRIAQQLQQLNPQWNDERLFQETRKIVIGVMQNIVYSEYLPSIIGFNAAGLFDILPQSADVHFSGYNPSVLIELFIHFIEIFVASLFQ